MKSLVQQQRFASSLITYVKAGTTPTLGKAQEEPILNHWAAHNEERGFSGHQCLVAHGLFDTVFKRRSIIPTNWSRFKRQFLSPLADLLDRLHQECQYPGSHSWTGVGGQMRSDFHMNYDFWTRRTQEENYQHLLGQLESRKLLRRKASRRYRNDPNAVSVLLNGQWTDIPGCYRMLEFAIQDMERDTYGTSSMDMPRVSETYGQRVPVMFMIGSTISYDPESSEGKVYQLVEKHTSPTPKLQDIIYVLAERRNGEYIPRHIGHMVAYMLEFVYGSPSGHIQRDFMYLVPQEDMSGEEKKSFDCSNDNWENHHQRFLETHPGLKSHLEK